MPKGVRVDETVYPLVGRQSGVMDHCAVAQELATLSSSAADQRASHIPLLLCPSLVSAFLVPTQTVGCVQGAFYIADVGMPNNYTFTKNLAEQLMLDLHTPDFPVSIVRPTIVSCVNASPAPGYFGNTSGAISFVMAFATGDLPTSCLPTISGSSLGVLDSIFCYTQVWLTTRATTRTTTSRMSFPVTWSHRSSSLRLLSSVR